MGSGDDIDEFIEISKILKVENKVHFNKKMLPLEELIEVIKDMDVGVVSNRKNIATEIMLPVKMLEYIALDIPVVAPRLKTIEYYFNDEMITYFQPGEIDSLAEAVLQLYKNKPKRRKQALRAKNFIKQYGWENHQKDFIRLYEELLL